MTSRSPASVVVEADGGSRGNPGRAAYGAVLLDASTDEVIAEVGECIGIATNNVAEYRGLLAGLDLHAEHAPSATLVVRMDSKLVVEQMSGRWKIKHPDMRPLAMAARGKAPAGTTYTWIPRERNKRADRLVNQALDAPAEAGAQAAPAAAMPVGDRGEPTTLILVRHGETPMTREKRFSGRSGTDPSLSEDGRAQVRAVADWLAPLAEDIAAVVTSPLRRTRETAAIIAERLGSTEDDVAVVDGLAEADFGTWDGSTFAEVSSRHPEELAQWLSSFEVAPGGGESFAKVDRRVRRARDGLIAAHPGRVVVASTHVTPIKLLVRSALGAPMEAVYRMELAPASVTVVAWYPDGQATMRMFNARPLA